MPSPISPLEKIKARALATATRNRRPLAILNLNRAGAALYVMREVDPTITASPGFICLVEPGEAASEESANG